MRAVLIENFPEYDEVVGPWGDREVALRKSPDSFVKGILVGDFNSDGRPDFAAKLSRPLSAEELEPIQPSLRERIATAEILVVCNAHSENQNATDYRCYELVSPEIGGIHGSLDFMEWEWYLQTLEEEDQPKCQAEIKTRVGTKSLSLLQPYGHCDTFFYPKKDGGYDECMFCAD